MSHVLVSSSKTQISQIYAWILIVISLAVKLDWLCEVASKNLSVYRTKTKKNTNNHLHTAWSIWKERTKRVYENKGTNEDQLAAMTVKQDIMSFNMVICTGRAARKFRQSMFFFYSELIWKPLCCLLSCKYWHASTLWNGKHLPICAQKINWGNL